MMQIVSKALVEALLSFLCVCSCHLDLARRPFGCMDTQYTVTPSHAAPV